LLFQQDQHTFKGEKTAKSWRKKLFEQKQARVWGGKKNGAVIFVAFYARNKKKGQRKGN